MRGLRWTVPVLTLLVAAMVVVPVRAQEQADVLLVNAVPDVVVDVDIDGEEAARGLAYGATVSGDVLGLAAGQGAQVEVREAGSTSVLALADVFVAARGYMVIHYDLEGEVAVSGREFLVESLCDATAEVELWSYANADAWPPLIDGEVPMGIAGRAPGEHEVAFVEEGTDTVLVGPERITVDAGEVALVFLTGSQTLGNLQLLTTLRYSVQTQDCTPRQPAPGGARPVGDLPDVQIVQAIAGLVVDVQLGRRTAEAVDFGQQVNDDELGGITDSTATVTVSLAGGVLVGPADVAITSDAGSLVIHRDGGGEPVVTYFEDPVGPLCQGEGELVFRNASGSPASWVVGTGPVADDETATFPGLFETPRVDSGQQWSRTVPAGDYLTRAFNFDNGEPVGGNGELSVGSGTVSTVYLVGRSPGVPLTIPPQGPAADQVALAALVRAADVPPAPPGTEIVFQFDPLPGSAVSTVLEPSVQSESCSPALPEDAETEPGASAGAIAGFVTGAAQVDQYVIVYEDLVTAEAALARHRALAEDCDAALAQRLGSDGEADATLSDFRSDFPDFGYRVRVEFRSDGSVYDEESAVLRWGPVLSFIRTSESGPPAGSDWEVDGLLDAAWADQLMAAAADRLTQATSDEQLLILGYNVATVACPKPATPGPAPAPERRYFATPAGTPQDGF